MIPLQLTLSNFLSYGSQEQTLDFTRFHVACLTGANGHGKSALLDAMTWALWGQARKGRHDRKPDEGLLRLGARQMRVEFSFSLDDGTYRVLRSFRRRPRTTVTELELQILDPDSGLYRPLSEAGATSVTQQRIDRLLAMDYETFVNSAFLLQGQADAFTRKGPRERKDLLARILGLERYDRLQDQARQQQQDRQRRLAAVSERSAGIESELEGRAEVVAGLTQADSELADLSTRLAATESELERLRERRLRAAAARDEAARLEQEVAAGAQRRAGLEAQLGSLEQRRAADAKLVQAAERIEAAAREHEALRAEDAELGRRLQEARRLEAACAGLERRIEAARHQLEQRRATWQARRDGLDQRLAGYDRALEEAAQIEAGHQAWQRDRCALEQARADRQTSERLRREQARAEHDVALEARRLEERARAAGARQAELDRWLRETAGLTQRLDAAQAELEAAGKRDAEMRRLREHGTGLRARAEQARERLADVEAEATRLDERLAALGRGELTDCPLCGTELDTDHRRRIDAELGDRRAELDETRQRLRTEVADLDEQLVDCGARFRALEAAAGGLAEIHQRVAALRAEAARVEQERQALAAVQAERAGLEARLSDGDFAVEARQRAAAAAAELTRLGFDEQGLAQLERRVADGAEADARHRLLQTARAERATAAGERAAAHQALQAAEAELTGDRFAADDAARLTGQREQLQALAYDETRHGQVRERLEALREAPAAVERLAAARQRLTEAEQEARRLRENLAAEAEGAAGLEQRRAELAAVLEGLTDVEEACRSQQGRLDELRGQRDVLVERRGSLQARRERLDGLEREAETLRAERAELERETWLYARLVEAFGKDGIQALVIDSAIPEIEDETNAILRRLTDNRIQIAIESLRDLKGGGSRETLDVKISDELGERAYDLYSGGEAFRTDFALRIALSKVLARRAGTRLRTLIIDEGFGTQDREGLEQLREAIQQVSADFDKVLVVTHLEELKAAFPVQIEVTKDADSGSRFRILT